jgi:putative membrane protein
MKKVSNLVAGAFLAAVVLAPGLASAQGQAAGERYGYGPGMMWDSGYGMFFGPIFMILTLAVVIAAIILLVQWLGGSWQGAQKPSGPAPLDILKARFARGEIDQKEFESRRKVLAE